MTTTVSSFVLPHEHRHARLLITALLTQGCLPLWWKQLMPVALTRRRAVLAGTLPLALQLTDHTVHGAAVALPSFRHNSTGCV